MFSCVEAFAENIFEIKAQAWEYSISFVIIKCCLTLRAVNDRYPPT